jgi:branched-chain amino acid transport system permease protein
VDQAAVQLLNGLATAASLFLVAAGLSIIFGVTRVVNFAHGSFYMLGAYVAYALVDRLGAGPLGFWGSVALATAAAAGIGALVEMLLLRRIYGAPELFQLLATFGVVLVVEDLVLLAFGPEERLGPRAPGLRGAISVLGRGFPVYNLFLIGVAVAILAGLWLLFRRTRWGTLVRAATEDREIVGALGVNQSRLFTGVFALGAALAGLGGALALPREPVRHTMDLEIIAEAFVVVVIGGMGSLPGAWLASVIIGAMHAFGILIFPEITLVLVFLVMAVVLVVRPWGLLGRSETLAHGARAATLAPLLAPPPAAARRFWAAALVALAAAPLVLPPYYVSVLSEILVFALFAASLHLLMGPGGLTSFGHAAYFGVGAYGAALAVTRAGLPMAAAIPAGALAGLGFALLYGWFCVRLSGVYLAMLTLAFAQITFAIAFQWVPVTGGSNGILGVWPAPWASGPTGFYYLALVLCAAAIAALRRAMFAPFGYSLRAARDSALRAEAIGIGVRRQQWLAFALAGLGAGLAGALYAFLKGSVFPDALSIPTSVDALVMVLLGGVHTVGGPIAGAVAYKALQILVTAWTDYWRLVVGVVILLLVLAFPQGIVGGLNARLRGKA